MKIRKGSNRVLAAVVDQLNRLRTTLSLGGLTDSTAGTPGATLVAMPDPADAPGTPDALRDDLVANTLPPIRNNFASLAAKINAIIGSVHVTQTSYPAAGDPPAATVVAITSPNATDLATSLVLCNELIDKGLLHLNDTVAHKAADGGSWPVSGAAVDLATAQTAANLMKGTYNTHIAATTKHYSADAANAIAAANASDQTTLNTLLNEMKPDVTAHIALAFTGHSIELIDA